MSGSGGGRYEPPARSKFECGKTAIRTTLTSINITVLKNHTTGDILNVIIGTNDSLQLENGNGEILGAILHSNTRDIIECIKNGFIYSATIVNIKSTTCVVRIKPDEL